MWTKMAHGMAWLPTGAMSRIHVGSASSVRNRESECEQSVSRFCKTQLQSRLRVWIDSSEVT